LGSVFLGMVMALPTGVISWFDGLPWTGPIETLVAFVLLPFLVILGYRFLSLRWPVIFLSVLLVLKFVMVIGAPASGWLVKVYPGMILDELKQNQWHKGMYEAVTSGRWVKTYTTSWNENASGILQAPWTHKKQFPVDWFLPNGVAPKNEFEQFEALNPWIQFEGATFLPKESSLVIVAQGVVDGTLEAFSLTGEKVILPMAKDYQEAIELAAQAPKGGGWTIGGKLQFKGTDWSFIPVLVDGSGTVISDGGAVGFLAGPVCAVKICRHNAVLQIFKLGYRYRYLPIFHRLGNLDSSLSDSGASSLPAGSYIQHYGDYFVLCYGAVFFESCCRIDK